MEAGLDSLGAVEVRNSFSSHFGIDLPATLIFDHPSISALASNVASFLRQDNAPGAALIPLQAPNVQVSAAANCGRTVIHGMSCQYPTNKSGQSGHGVQSFWKALQYSADLPQIVPLERWDADLIYSPDPIPWKSYARFASFLPDVAVFDAEPFSMSR
jgi:Phosphopantetheine attachment site/Beta-ketoacyl synthase, N-terminal domain